MVRKSGISLHLTHYLSGKSTEAAPDFASTVYFLTVGFMGQQGQVNGSAYLILANRASTADESKSSGLS